MKMVEIIEYLLKQKLAFKFCYKIPDDRQHFISQKLLIIILFFIPYNLKSDNKNKNS